MAEEPDGFLGRWARRKQELREGKPLSEPAPPAPDKAKVLASVPPGSGMPAVGAAPAPAPAPEQKPAAPPPTLDDVKTLTQQSDFRRFVASDVDPEVKNAAMRKLFADPHFNVMDGLDIYIEDYNTPNPLPLAMLRQMTSAKVLGLVQDDKKSDDKDKDKDKKAQAATDTQRVDNSGQSIEPANPQAVNETQAEAIDRPAGSEQTETDQDADPDLRLQQDHAAGPPGSGGRAQ